MITKLGITMGQLSKAFRRAVAPRIKHLYTPDRLFPNTLSGPMSFDIAKANKKFIRVLNGKVPTAVHPSVGRVGIFNKDDTQAFKQLISQHKDLVGMRGDQGIVGMENIKAILKSHGITNAKDRRIIRKIFGLHEAQEFKALAKNIKQGKRYGVDYTLPTMHHHPDVIFHEHSLLSTLKLEPVRKKRIIEAMRTLRAANKLPGSPYSDLDVYEKVLKEYGGYGTGKRIPRSKISELKNKVMESYYN